MPRCSTPASRRMRVHERCALRWLHRAAGVGGEHQVVVLPIDRGGALAVLRLPVRSEHIDDVAGERQRPPRGRRLEVPQCAVTAELASQVQPALVEVHVYRLIQDEGPTVASTVTYLLPIVAVVLGAAILTERLAASSLTGGIAILIGVALTQRSRQDDTERGILGGGSPPGRHGPWERS